MKFTRNLNFQIFALFILVILLPKPSWSQKAYDVLDYKGKTQNITVHFKYAYGYSDASEIKTTDNKTKRTSSFLPVVGLPDSNQKMKFYHHSISGKKFTDYFILEGIKEYYDSIPSKINGKYFFNDKSYDLILYKK